MKMHFNYDGKSGSSTCQKGLKNNQKMQAEMKMTWEVLKLEGPQVYFFVSPEIQMKGKPPIYIFGRKHEPDDQARKIAPRQKKRKISRKGASRCRIGRRIARRNPPKRKGGTSQKISKRMQYSHLDSSSAI